MTPLRQFVTLIAPRVPRCPEPTIFQAVRQAVQQFCQRTRLWREHDKFRIGGDGFDYVFAPQGAVLHEIEYAAFNGKPLKPVPLSWLNSNMPMWRDIEGSDAQYITQIERDTIRVVPAASGEVEILAILKPSDDAAEVPDFIANSHRTVIRDGALAELMTIPGQPFFNPDLAAYHASRFERALDVLSSSSVKGQQRAAVRSVPHYF